MEVENQAFKSTHMHISQSFYLLMSQLAKENSKYLCLCIVQQWHQENPRDHIYEGQFDLE